MSHYFKRYEDENQHIFEALSKELKCYDNFDRSKRTLAAVLRALRHRLDFEKVNILIEAIPGGLKPVLLDEWYITKHEPDPIVDLDDFLMEVRKQDGHSAIQDFTTREEGLFTIYSVFNVLEKFISAEQMEKVWSLLTKGVREKFEQIYGQPASILRQRQQEFLYDLALELGHTDDIKLAQRITDAIFRAIRTRISYEESVALLDLLPKHLKAFYLNEWNIREHTEIIQSQDDFVSEVLIHDKMADDDLMKPDKGVVAIKDFFRCIARHLDKEACIGLQSVLPDAINQLWHETVLI